MTDSYCQLITQTPSQNMISASSSVNTRHHHARAHIEYRCYYYLHHQRVVKDGRAYQSDHVEYVGHDKEVAITRVADYIMDNHDVIKVATHLGVGDSAGSCQPVSDVHTKLVTFLERQWGCIFTESISTSTSTSKLWVCTDELGRQNNNDTTRLIASPLRDAFDFRVYYK